MPTDGHDSTLFVNVTGNNMMDYVNRKRFTIIKTKSVTLKLTHGLGRVVTIHTFETGADQVDAANASARSGPIMKIVRMSVPGTTFGESGNIIYDPALNSPHAKFFEYSVHILTYVNSIKTDANVAVALGGGRLNCYVRRHYFTDHGVPSWAGWGLPVVGSSGV